MDGIIVGKFSEKLLQISNYSACFPQHAGILVIWSLIVAISILITAFFWHEILFFLLVPICALGIGYLIEFPGIK